MVIDPEHMTEDMVMHILRNKDGLCRQKQEQIREIQKELLQLDRLAATAALPGSPGTEIRSVTNHVSDLSEVLLDIYKREKEMEKSLLTEYKGRAGELEAIRRVWIAFQALPYEEYDILYRLCVKKELWTSLEESYNHRNIIKIRKHGLRLILELYESSYLNREIADRRFLRPGPDKKKRKAAGQGETYQQISLPFIDKKEETHHGWT